MMTASLEPFAQSDAELVHAALVASPEFRAAMFDALTAPPADAVERIRARVMAEVPAR